MKQLVHDEFEETMAKFGKDLFECLYGQILMTFKNQMAFAPSKAAIAAITVLQERIKELEAEKIGLQQGIESLQIQIHNKRCEITENETNLISATNRARQMIENASLIINRIHNARLENNQLRRNIALAEEQLNQLDSGLDSSCQKELSKRKIILKNLEEYRKLLHEIFSNINQDHFGVFLSSLEIAKIDYDPDLLPHPIRDVVHKLKLLPTQYKMQPVQKQRAIIQGLIRSVELANELVFKIRELQGSQEAAKTPRRVGFDIRTHAVNLYVLTREIRRFSFVS